MIAIETLACAGLVTGLFLLLNLNISEFTEGLGTAYFDYRKHGQFDWAPPAILFVCLVLMLTAPMYVWKILGI